jgi:hypothetical protein
VALMLGIGMRIAAAVGALVTVLMWAAVLPPASNPFMDEHLVYAGVLVALAWLSAGTPSASAGSGRPRRWCGAHPGSPDHRGGSFGTGPLGPARAGCQTWM